MRRGWIVAMAVLALTGRVAAAPPSYRDISDTYGEHTRAVELGRAGKYDQALAILGALLTHFPDDYPLQRDYTLIAAWEGDCPAALARFERIRADPRLESYLIAPLQDCGVRRAREGRYDEGLRIFEPFLRLYPDHYPLRRDAILITIWKNDCRRALRMYEDVRGRSELEPYFVVPVGDCLLEEGRVKEAVTLLAAAAERHPADTDIEHAREKALLAFRTADDLDDERRRLAVDLWSDDSDQGLREWDTRTEVSAHLAPRTRLYARYSTSDSDQAEFAAGDRERAGLGVRHRVNERWRIEQEFSLDVRESGKGGSSTILTHEPRDNLRLDIAYYSFAEDLPLRARAAGVEGHRWSAAAGYFTYDDRWFGNATLDRYDLNDGNRRGSEYVSAGHMWQRLPQREQRVFLEHYQSRNTRDDAPYFNPRRDRSSGIVHRTDFIFDSRFKSHVDRLELALGTYRQEGFGSHGRWAVTYEQEYELDDDNRIEWAIGYRNNVYDGARERQWSVRFQYERWF
jgi:tetratricopeptide (TPR) repeat protein